MDSFCEPIINKTFSQKFYIKTEHSESDLLNFY